MFNSFKPDVNEMLEQLDSMDMKDLISLRNKLNKICPITTTVLSTSVGYIKYKNSWYKLIEWGCEYSLNDLNTCLLQIESCNAPSDPAEYMDLDEILSRDCQFTIEDVEDTLIIVSDTLFESKGLKYISLIVEDEK